MTNKKIARHFEKHRCVTWRHTGSDQSTNVYPRDAPSLLRFYFLGKISSVLSVAIKMRLTSELLGN